MDFATLITNHTTTLNGAVSNRSSLNACLDLFSMGVSASNKEQLIRAALAEDPLLATKVVFYLRDCRQGLYRTSTSWYYKNYLGERQWMLLRLSYSTLPHYISLQMELVLTKLYKINIKDILCKKKF